MIRISGDINFEILVEDSDTGGPSLITVRIECLFAFQFWYCELCVKNQWGGWAESIILLVFIWCGYFSYRWLRGGGVGQKVIFRSSWNRIFCLLLRLKSRRAWGAFRRPAFMVLVLIKGTRRGRWVQDFVLLPQGFESFPSDLSRAGWPNLLRVEYL